MLVITSLGRVQDLQLEPIDMAAPSLRDFEHTLHLRLVAREVLAHFTTTRTIAELSLYHAKLIKNCQPAWRPRRGLIEPKRRRDEVTTDVVLNFAVKIEEGSNLASTDKLSGREEAVHFRTRSFIQYSFACCPLPRQGCS